jgi:hypothetical protein
VERSVPSRCDTVPEGPAGAPAAGQGACTTAMYKNFGHATGAKMNHIGTRELLQRSDGLGHGVAVAERLLAQLDSEAR